MPRDFCDRGPKRTVLQKIQLKISGRDHALQEEEGVGWGSRRGGRSRDALEGKGPQRRPPERLSRRLGEVAKAAEGGYCRLQMPLKLARAVRGTVARHRLGALEGGGGGGRCPPSNASLDEGGGGGGSSYGCWALQYLRGRGVSGTGLRLRCGCTPSARGTAGGGPPTDTSTADLGTAREVCVQLVFVPVVCR